jgi:hypothetical protein
MPSAALFGEFIRNGRRSDLGEGAPSPYQEKIIPAQILTLNPELLRAGSRRLLQIFWPGVVMFGRRG